MDFEKKAKGLFRILVDDILLDYKNYSHHWTTGRALDMSPFPLLPRDAYVSILLSEVEPEQRPSGNGDREAVVVGADLCDSEGECANTECTLH